MDAYLQSLAAKGYGWYLALKIVKALLSVPLFVCWIGVLSVLAVCIGVWDAIKAFAWDLPAGMVQEARDFWAKRWLSGFSRAYYSGLSHYKPAPTPLPAEDRQP